MLSCLPVKRLTSTTFGRGVVNFETGHKPLEEILKKSSCDAPARLQRMLLRLRRYNLKVRCKKGPLMLIADMLSRAYLRDTLPSEEVKSLEVVDHSENLPAPASRLAQIEQESVQDPVFTNLRQAILAGWPGSIQHS